MSRATVKIRVVYGHKNSVLPRGSGPPLKCEAPSMWPGSAPAVGGRGDSRPRSPPLLRDRSCFIFRPRLLSPGQWGGATVVPITLGRSVLRTVLYLDLPSSRTQNDSPILIFRRSGSPAYEYRARRIGGKRFKTSAHMVIGSRAKFGNDVRVLQSVCSRRRVRVGTGHQHPVLRHGHDLNRRFSCNTSIICLTNFTPERIRRKSNNENTDTYGKKTRLA